jgi:GTPase SAR1 family protein
MDDLHALCYELMGFLPEFQGILKELDDLLPSIAIVGAQSSGKSTLLNRLLPYVLSSTLPVGEGTCTKLPTAIRMIKKPQNYLHYKVIRADGTISVDEEYPQATVDQLQAILLRIQELNSSTRSIFGYKIFLDVGAPDVQTPFELVDLPGLMVADDVYGDDIERNVINYLKKAHLIIVTDWLVNDIQTCYALKVAKHCLKRDGQIIFVSTRADDHAAGAKRVQETQKFLGPQKITWALATNQAPRTEEKAFLEQRHPVIRGDTALPILKGADELSNKIASLYLQLVASKTPAIREKLMLLQTQLRSELAALGDAPKSKSILKAELVVILSTLNDSRTNAELDRCKQRGIQLLLEHVPANLIRTILTDDFIEETLAQGSSSERIPGTEGMYKYLEAAFRNIANQLNATVDTILDQYLDDLILKISEILSKRISNSRASALKDRLIAEASSTARKQIQAMKAFMEGEIHRDPTCSEPYPHYAVTDFVVQSAFDSLGRKDVYTHNEINQLYMRLGELFRNQPESILTYNVKNLVWWFWSEHYHRGITQHCKDLIFKSVDEILRLLLAVVVQAPDDIFSDEDEATVTRRVFLRRVIDSVEQILRRMS